MGVDISSIVPKKERSISSFKGKSIAIDAFNSLYQFLASIRQLDGTPLKDFDGNITSHLSGIFYRSINLIENGITPIYVFDGEPPEFKKKEIDERKKRKEEYKLLLEKAKDLENEDDIKRYSQASIHLTKKQVEETKKLLSSMGIFYVDAPSEGEAQAAYMSHKNLVYASASQDYDSLLFGASRLIRNLSISGKRKLPRRNEYVIVYPEEIILDEILSKNSINQEKLIIIGILVGTDFNKGVRGIGPKKALKLVNKFDDFESIKSYVEEKYSHHFEHYIKDVINFFLEPPVKDVDIKTLSFDEEKIKEILVEEHDFSEQRVSSAIEKMKRAKENMKQTSLSSWF